MSKVRTDPFVWITGAGGLIGNALVEAASRLARGWRVHALTRTELDLLDFDAVRRLFRNETPELVIHCAALTDTTACQKDARLAHALNVESTSVLAELAQDIPLLFFSTDLVFDGRTGNYDESAQVNPLSIYAKTKVAAERVVLSNPKHTVIRASLNGGASPTGNRGFNEQLRRAFESGRTVTLFTDEFRCPIPAVETARVIWDLAALNRPGIYHVAGAERLSRWQIGQLLAARWPQLNPKLEPASLTSYRGAPRAPDSSMNCAKVQNLLSFPLPRLSEWLAAHPDVVF
jgi:dTDP-4-dehydrorhamnose reductase